VAARMCPDCLRTVPAGKVLAYSNDLVCRDCGKPLDISALSRNIAAFAGLIVAVIVWWLASKHYAGDPWALAWVLPIVFSYFTFSIVTPLVLVLVADLEIKSDVAPAPVHHEPSTHHSSH
jgi:hypothetical protein